MFSINPVIKKPVKGRQMFEKKWLSLNTPKMNKRSIAYSAQYIKALFIAITAIAFLYNKVSGQTDNVNPDNFAKMVDFLPPAPNATSIIKYGGISLNKNNGAPSINIPITSVSSKKVATSVSLGYYSTGIKVDEIASRVGMGWTLLAGGVITRTVRGTADEVNTRVVPWAPIDVNFSTFNFMDKVAKSTNYGGGYDSEPDLFNFNFNGYSGSFVFDESMKITPVEPNRFKYYYNFSGTDWTFKIVTTDGVSYYFGGSSATEKTKQDQTCGKLFDNYLATAWYLTKIQHPNGDVILFSYSPLEYTYDNGVNQTMYYTKAVAPYGGQLGSCASTVCSSPADVNCVTLTRTQGVLLKDITVPGNQELDFDYTTRSDCNDRLVSRISLYDISQQSSVLVKAWNMVYDQIQGTGYTGSSSDGNTRYTPYLVNLIERSADSTQLLKHAFLYNDPAARPPRLSYAQDHWGYFNGNNNVSLIPPPNYTGATYPVGYFTLATANRNAVTSYAVKGMLSKIIYPTGGMDSLVYESNQVTQSGTAGPQYQLYSTVTGTGNFTEVDKSNTFNINTTTPQYIKLDFQCINTGGGTPDPLHNKGGVDITGPSGLVYSYEFVPGDHIIDSAFVTTSGTYTITIHANGAIITTKGSVYYIPSITNYSYSALVGGLRIKALVSAADGQSTPIIKQYFYGDISTPWQSSLQPPLSPIYSKIYQTRYLCQSGGEGTDAHHLYCDHLALYSNSLNALYDFEYSQPSYASVIEVTGTDMNVNGAVQTKFYASTDPAPEVVWGNSFLNAPKSNTMTLLNGKVQQETVFKPVGGVLKPIKQTSYTYILDTAVNKFIPGYSINKKYYNDITEDSTCNPAAQNSDCYFILNECLNAFDMSRYYVLSRWVYTDSIKQTVYDENGNNPITTITKNYYSDTSNLLLTQADTHNSKGDLERMMYSYPKNYAGTTVYDSMLSRNIISPAIDIMKYVNSTKIEEIKTNYQNWGSGNFLPSSVQKAYLNNSLQNQGQITKYNTAGNILEYKGRDGITVSIIYGYHNLYPVAKITGADFNTAIAQLTADTSQLQNLDGTALTSALNNIRNNLNTAQVTSYTYKHLTGILSITDPGNHIQYYNYDSLHRLASIQDNNHYYLKKMAYSYAQPNASLSPHVYFSGAASQTFYCQCSTGYVAVPIMYAIDAGKYISINSQADADSLADADVAANGQEYANNYGRCSTSCDYCSGIDKKCVNGVCEMGHKFLLSSVQKTSTTWLCTFYYKFSDGSTSENFTETSTDPGCGWL